MSDLQNPNYRPGELLDCIAKKLDVANDAQPAAKLAIPASRISISRSAVASISDGVLIRMNALAGFTSGDMRKKMGLPRRKYNRD
jgi:hypothetical protein